VQEDPKAATDGEEPARGAGHEPEADEAEVTSDSQVADGDAPLKICRHCSVASRTESEDCPACGRPYAREINWKIPGAIAIIIVAFFIGFFGRMVLDDGGDGDSDAITVEQASSIEIGSTEAEVVDMLAAEPLDRGNAPLTDADEAAAAAVDRCVYYSLVDTEDAVWEFCFAQDSLLISDRADLG